VQTTTEKEKQSRELFSQENLHLIYRYIYSYVRNRQEAEDLTSQIFLKAVRRLDLEQSAHSRQAWLFQVAQTTSAPWCRLCREAMMWKSKPLRRGTRRRCC